jgi:predicted alpha/beta superfamily hydrolase
MADIRRGGAFAAVVAIWLGATLLVQPAVSATIVSESAATQAEARQFVLHSTRLGRDFAVVVTPPQTPILPGQKLPVIYALDAGYGIAGQEARLLAGDGGMAPSFIVSIGYVDGQPNLRETDLAHRPFTDGGAVHGGGGAAFETFLLDEARPFIEARYPVDPARSSLLGHSLAGLFTANVLADHPDAFSVYLIGSPSIWADPDVLAHVAAAASRGHGRRVFIGVGGKETAQMTQGAEHLADVLGRPPSSFVVRKQVFEGQVHMSYYPQLVMSAFVFASPAPPLPPQPHEIAVESRLLDRYVGVYRMADGRNATVSQQEGHLFGQITGLPQVQLFAETPTTFFVKGFDAELTFVGAEVGPARSLSLRLNGALAGATRVN